MAPSANPRWIEALPGLFGSNDRADCDIQFCQEVAEPSSAGADLGPPIPAHSFVLSMACERFRAQARRIALERWEEAPPATKRAKGCSEASGKRPLLRVSLGSEAELPAARLALRFAYTGLVHASSIREALEVLRAGDYLAIEGCAAACSQWLADRLATTGAAEVGSPEAAEPAVLQLYACERLWPSGDPGFAAVLSAVKAQLVRHFGSTLAALNTPALRQQLEALPAAGLEALLESDDLATDSEDSVLTLVATWMRANWARTDAATRQRLCGLVRLTQLSPQAVSCLLLPLAADFETKGRGEQAGWFPLSVTEAALLCSYHSAPEPWQKKAREDKAAAGVPSWHSASPRKQCVPETGLSYPWNISKEDLKVKMEGLQPGEKAKISIGFGDGAAVLLARGFEWKLKARYFHGDTAAGLYLRPEIPAAYKVPGSRFEGIAVFESPGSRLASPVRNFAACIDARLTVNRRQGGRVSEARVTSFDRTDYTRVDQGWGARAALPIASQQPAASLAAAAGDVLAGWAEYAHEGSAVTGTLTLLPPK